MEELNNWYQESKDDHLEAQGTFHTFFRLTFKGYDILF